MPRLLRFAPLFGGGLQQPEVKMETIEVLISARQLIAKPDCWTRRRYVADKYDKPSFPNHPRACRFSTVGAIAHVVQGEITDQDKAWMALNETLRDRARSELGLGFLLLTENQLPGALRFNKES